ncbi:hypothetical protein CRI77_13785 [Mycolicibacterium duvalii]|uniref:Uncharacterized protein n=1 Tax=Mycolicibacterium duvalii TaxID=39688 RepID=A0A7I7JXF2_9MYCO|nr:hypothetical protein [Mycolicibacterium duvalii]MCV7367005.1 hypothetical protein [Mycolicibacterium duvalii]PEG40310.1 hypothetical protein CRI77_13785 [Mycolicibacterium duvalii]BBX15871.1 hypothetical protein MDUV_07310 [Mycolicibacterium duvalii]
MSALSLHPASPLGTHRHLVSAHEVAHWISTAVHATFARTVEDTGPRVPRHYPERRTAFMEQAAMQREMFRL